MIVGLAKADEASSEIVAELGGCILLTILGYERGADRGGAFKYVKSWSGKETATDVAKACSAMLERTCNAVALILQTAKTLGEGGTADDVGQTTGETDVVIDRAA